MADDYRVEPIRAGKAALKWREQTGPEVRADGEKAARENPPAVRQSFAERLRALVKKK